ncbi:MAG: tetratricopeptide repeat protein [Myxococcales bacterium FL481]|nr:MAG: tetratricopeptide repeat protein [Myxococcales bacterium FL481]
MALARAARARRDVVGARAALHEFRSRFPNHPAASRATFLLGRVAEDLANDAGQAASWFARYLQEYPSGPLAGQARGRLLSYFNRRGDKQNAERIALECLRSDPDGPYSDLARAILSGSGE